MRIELEEVNFSHSVRVLLYEKRGDEIYLAKPINLVFEKQQQGSIWEPTFTVYHAASFLKSMSEALHQMGIKPDHQSKTEGLLEATKYHLEDMRKLALKINGS